MIKVGIIVNREKDKNLKYTKILIESLKKRGADIKACSDILRETNIKAEGLDEEGVFDNSDIIICLGGDGSFLGVARKVYKRNIPILGINLGALGFLTEVEKKDIDKAVECIIGGKYSIEERMMLETEILREDRILGKDIALNDVVISRGALSRILHVSTYINGTFVDSFPGDGLIVSTPTGSTGYTLSTGGPIVEPDVDIIIVSPICPHILYSRSFITTGDRTVKAVIQENYSHSAMVTVDGQKGYEVRGGDVVTVKKSEYKVKLVRINTRNFFNILRSKIYYRGEKVLKNEI
ncbi:MAG: NAD(+)/NADH kinase [Acetivibrionales bacterium]|jgi:NAD+ kinase